MIVPESFPFLFSNKAIKLAFELSLYFFFFADINNFFLNDQTMVLSGMYSEKPRNLLKEIRSIIVSQVQSRNKHAIDIKKRLKNDMKRFLSN